MGWLCLIYIALAALLQWRGRGLWVAWGASLAAGVAATDTGVGRWLVGLPQTLTVVVVVVLGVLVICDLLDLEPEALACVAALVLPSLTIGLDGQIGAVAAELWGGLNSANVQVVMELGL